MEQAVLFDIEDQTALITLNRPERRNAMNQALLSQLYDAVDRVTSDDSIRVAIITGQGKAFCSGIDLGCLGKDNLFDPRGDGSDMLSVFGACTKPIIGAVNGPTITGGFELALNCDFLIASENACFADTHAKVVLSVVLARMLTTKSPHSHYRGDSQLEREHERNTRRDHNRIGIFTVVVHSRLL